MLETRSGLDRWSGAFRMLPITLAIAVVMACGTAFADNPVPFIDLPTVPSAAVPGGSGFTLTVNGAGFVNGSVVKWNGSARSTTFVSAAQVTSLILASDVANAKTASITVSNPAPGGGTSNVAYFEVTTPASTVNVTGLQLPAFNSVYFSIAADLNNDGKLDLILFSDSIVHGVYVTQGAVALGNGDGTFQPGITIGGSDFNVLSVDDIVVGDFNGDGKLDIATLTPDRYPTAISVMLGNGDGTFQAPIVSGSQPNNEYNHLAVGDFNQDGKLDVIADSAFGISFLAGNGDGTFQSPVNYSRVFSPSFQLTVGDFNGDGVLDLLGFQSSEASAVLPGNGDGTFQSPVWSSFPFVGNIENVSAADVNGDGKADVIYLSWRGVYTETSTVLLGDGNGAFSAVSSSVTGLPAFPPGDFNGDGKLDFVTSLNTFIGQCGHIDDLTIWIGNGDGTFAPSVPIATTTGECLAPLIQGDFNRDGKMDVLAEDQDGGVWMFLQGSFPVGSLSPGSLNFGSQTVGTTSAPQIVTLRNTGTETLTLSPVTISGANASEFEETQYLHFLA